MMFIMRKILVILILVMCPNLGVSSLFSLPERLKPNVDFWTKIYSFYDTNQVVFHDLENFKIYDVLELPKVVNQLSSQVYKKEVKNKLKQISESLDKDETKRLRAQSGLKSQFAVGLKISGRYVDEMKAILKSFDLPSDLIAMVFVESLFNLSASSGAGASGPWGLIKETAQTSGIFVNRFTDERLDPVVATVGAAQFLKKTKERLGNWPLTITAFNCGHNGMDRAAKNLGTNQLEVIIEQHESPIFGFASKNYYAEVLAAMRIFDNHEKYFPGLTKDQPWNYDLVQLLRPIEVSDLLTSKAISKTDLISFNPGLTKRTLEGHEVIPANYALRVPKGYKDLFYDKVKGIPNKNREQAQWKISTKYHAKGNETLELIAKKNGIDSQFLADRLGESTRYRPKGAIIIRSQAHRFSPLLEIGKDILASIIPSKIIKNANQD